MKLALRDIQLRNSHYGRVELIVFALEFILFNFSKIKIGSGERERHSAVTLSHC